MIPRPPISIGYGETKNLAWDWTGELEERATTLVTSAWESTDNNVTITNKTIAGNKAKATITAAIDPIGSLRNTVILANGETLIASAHYL